MADVASRVGAGRGNWLADGNISSTSAYLLSLYWSTLTLTTIGNSASPRANAEFVFTILSYFIGVFVFATVVGQARQTH